MANVPTIKARTILQKVRYDGSKWFGLDYSMNLYRGCNHGCIYCDSRSECYRNDDFDTVKVKENAIKILQSELRPHRTKGVVGLGAMSDSYNPHEKELRVTRQALELLADCGYGISLETKSDLVTRDIDLFQQIAKKHSAIVKLTITAADDDLARIIEPHAPSSSKRFRALRELADAGIYCGVLFTPTLPFITDNEENIRTLVNAAAENGAQFIYHMEGVTMRDRQRDHFYEKISEYNPDLPGLYQKTFGDRYMCNSPHAKENRILFQNLCKEYGLTYRMNDIIKAYKREIPDPQLSLF